MPAIVLKAVKFRKLLSVFCFALVIPLAAQQDGSAGLGTDIDALRAVESFRIGIEAYNRYEFNNAIQAFEQALSYRPDQGLILDWLGRAYYRSGIEATALREWQAAAEAYGSSSPEYVQIRSRIEIVRARRSLLPVVNSDSRYVESGHFPGLTSDDILRFSQPSSMLSEENGSSWVVCYGSNEIVRLDVNGIVRQRERGPVQGFDRPYDMVRGLDGRLYVSEFRGGCISVLNSNGAWQSRIGTRGIHDGELLGAAGLAVDDEGYIYVVEYGNQRISKFDPDGNFIYNFGKKGDDFAGFLSPTGIAAKGGRVFVADSIAKCIYSFDSNGMYLGAAIKEGLQAPESLKFLDDGTLLVADTKRMLRIDLDSTIVEEISRAGNESIRFIGAGTDQNGNILAANFTANEVTILNSLNDVASGFFVQINRVESSNFPLVMVELAVQNASRRPISGLDQSNFTLLEDGRPVNGQTFMGAEDSEGAVVSVLIERSLSTEKKQTEIAQALLDIAAGVDISSIVSAGNIPSFERFNTESVTSLKNAAQSTAWTDRWRFDLGLRLAATELLPLSQKRAVIFVSSGELGSLAYEQYSLSELAAYLANNGIVFYALLTGQEQASDEINYLCEQTGGYVMPLYNPQGLLPLTQQLAKKSSGTYVLSYNSGLFTDFGKAFLETEAEVYLLERSGRDVVGYFAPME
ncbi:MAG: 6-bladed beta-propeller [Spirochaetaceae bacterium]|jgi:DNA-binding beta-propeller fold protein YncE|nr:6-bladed beta-propeller [Spirochaetaceae bacterium]